MSEPFKIYKFTAEDAERTNLSPDGPHYHDYEELLIGLEGQIAHFIDFKVTTFKAPYISFVTKGKLHQLKPMILDGKCDIWVMQFSTEFIPDTVFRLYAYYHDNANVEVKENVCFNRLATLCEMMYDEMQQPNPKLAIVHDLLKLLFTMIEAEREKLMDDGVVYPNVQNTTFKNFLKIIEENFRRPEGVDFYAEKLFMSSRNLNLICQSILNKSVSEIIETRKLIEAKNLLIYTDMSVSEIGFELGYNEKAYFTSVFKKKSGQTPTEFREEMRRLVS